MGVLGSAVVGFVVFMLTTPVRTEAGGIADCYDPGPCPQPADRCWTLLGWQDVLGPSSCSPWGAAAAGLLVGLAVRALGAWRA